MRNCVVTDAPTKVASISLSMNIFQPLTENLSELTQVITRFFAKHLVPPYLATHAMEDTYILYHGTHVVESLYDLLYLSQAITSCSPSILRHHIDIYAVELTNDSS